MTALAFRLLLLVLVAAAFAWGGRGERLGAVAYLAAAAATELVRSGGAHRYAHLEWCVFGVDAALLVALLALASRSSSWWPVCAASLQALTVLGHVAKLLNPAIWPLAYAWMIQASSFPSLLVLGLGVLGARRDVSSPVRAGP